MKTRSYKMTMTKLAVLCVMVLVLVLALAATAQQSATPAKAADSKDLAATLKLIQDRINEQGEIHYTMVSENPGRGVKVENKYAIQTGHAVADPQACTLTVEAHMARTARCRAMAATRCALPTLRRSL